MSSRNDQRSLLARQPTPCGGNVEQICGDDFLLNPQRDERLKLTQSVFREAGSHRGSDSLVLPEFRGCQFR